MDLPFTAAFTNTRQSRRRRGSCPTLLFPAESSGLDDSRRCYRSPVRSTVSCACGSLASVEIVTLAERPDLRPNSTRRTSTLGRSSSTTAP